ncbi:zinc ribbon domain-containing protein [Litorilinea aerophila]|uniref:Zinc ribbon domain-containing protein n=1 Tax=Litorilinea aerophila TaxID=1204385 RepID=A0A540VAR8_9CHLR|nr:zinc ribbon domain-containing protein [Litorilinea aerophila]MCC9078253.1 zinc ribbon domain-containing protein [Litorilinea aerophila]OUC06400.1 hypothetical protein RY27_21265 [Litorilinea aerophila]
MPRKELGYVQLEWTCPACQTRNPGPQRTCSGCGAPQPDDVEFHLPAEASLLTDEETAAQAAAGPDIHCPYCDARNPADAQTCRQCGAQLDAGKKREAGAVLGAFQPGPAPEVQCPACGAQNPASARVCQQCGAALGRPTKTAPAARPRPAPSGGCLRYVLLAVGLLVAAMITYGVLANRTAGTVGTVVEARWTQTIQVEGLVPVERSAWRDEIPPDVTVEACTAQVREVVDEPVPGSQEICGTPYTVDTGTGLGQVVQDCRYQVYADRCTYQVEEWQVIDRVTATGNDLAPRWPVLSLAEGQREGERSARYECVFMANDRQYAYQMRSVEEWAQCQPNSRWLLEINTFGQVVSARPE